MFEKYFKKAKTEVDSGREKPDIEHTPDKEIISQKINDRKNEIKRKDENKIKELRNEIQTFENRKSPAVSKSPEEIQEYISRNIPDYLETGKPSVFYKAFKGISRLFIKEVIGKEKLPQESKLFIANHRGGESGRLMAALDQPVHIAAAETINWQSGKIMRWILKNLGMVSIKETFSNLSSEQQQQVIEKSRVTERELHREVVEQKPNLGDNLKNVRAMVALLLRGEDVAIFAEGPFSRLADDERWAYAGYALVAREYKRISGKELNIIPTGIRNNKVAFGESFVIDQQGKQTKEELQDMATEKIHNLYNVL